ncbi:MAG: histidinol dehydrogenase [Candidatus Omnitrophica bacterium]|nr:histidinol dehydrogenase [Candidatus Omnitrophota bacterium]
MQVIYWDKNNPGKVDALAKQSFDNGVYKKVYRIMQEVAKRGDPAIRRFTKEFDGIDIPPKRMRVSQGDVNRAYEKIDVQFVTVLNRLIENVRRYYKKEIKKSYRIKSKDGSIVGKKYTPLERVGIYIPGGQAPLVSTIYMTAVPAQVAGVKEIVMVTPPDREAGYINPYLLVVADLLGIKEIYKIGGAQAIAALTFGTKTIKKVDKVAGPGNQYVTEAKRQAYGFVDIDMTAGPSEVAIIADRYADPNIITCDLLSQAEHVGGVAVLITYSKKIVEQVRKRVENGYIIVVKNLDEAVAVANEIAPEHLEILTQNPKRMLNKIKNAGAIFLGAYSPAVIGDYVAGPSHVLPTGGTAKYFSPLSVSDFIKSSQYIYYTREALLRSRDDIRKMTDIEGLILHRLSVEARFPEIEKNIKENKGDSNV